jgi:dienelactone hydrolase
MARQLEEDRVLNERIAFKVLGIVLLLASFFVAHRVFAAKRDHSTGQTAAKQPPQAGQGPGSGDYRHHSVRKTLHGVGENGYWLFEPADPTPSEAPVVFFLHGGRGMNPRDYGGWIDHLARRGNIVVYPVFEKAEFMASTKDSNDVLTQRAFTACKEAVEFMKKSGGGRPRLDRVAVTGHSFGGGLTPQFAGRAERVGLPVPKAIMPVEPGWKGKEEYPADVLKDIPPSVLALIVVGEDDQFGESRKGDVMFRAMSAIPPNHKRYVIMHSDNHGTSPLVADHSVPLSARDDYGTPLTGRQVRRRAVVDAMTGMVEGVVDAFDYNGVWKLFDLLCDTAFSGKEITAVVPGDTWDMGRWSDGTPIKPMTVTANP